VGLARKEAWTPSPGTVSLGKIRRYHARAKRGDHIHRDERDLLDRWVTRRRRGKLAQKAGLPVVPGTPEPVRRGRRGEHRGKKSDIR